MRRIYVFSFFRPSSLSPFVTFSLWFLWFLVCGLYAHICVPGGVPSCSFLEVSFSLIPISSLAQSVLLAMTDTSIRYLATGVHCVGVVELVCSGDISVTDGIDRLIVFRRSRTSEQRMSAVGALQNLACNPDVSIARAARRVLHERFVDDAWQLFTQYHEVWRRRGGSTTKS